MRVLSNLQAKCRKRENLRRAARARACENTKASQITAGLIEAALVACAKLEANAGNARAAREMREN